ncbi:maltose-6'-phosphate glucosidase [Tetragenococcus osmophilus]|uniref:Maltose-6'-phosphate glucosidase n=1 Tax=Tetragenococcus osmophilus TaxID=526944 RepID=A0AA38CZB5_9ENTE|nr:6-phospho-alpha-glucosidase [Tetragenococcus osmophilus]AYW47280.1 maltose-6'-phosphate glucosidase [Tetragenococcus osmophilus]GMA52806.1 maltose-6'-phosphate glucosidase [Alicyclobacillus contaminans]GMA73195.1 maltose-6'-phosphate glucosidase [Tetragenococcus osmophilus]
MSNVITIAGGGSGHTPGIVLTLLKNQEDFPIQEIRLYDIDEERNHDMEIIIDFLLKKHGFDIPLLATLKPEEAFTGVDFVFSQIRVGGIEMRELDEKIPLNHGIVGQETCGLGGFSYGMRSMKGFLGLISDIQEYAPDAWILNYTNPETIIAESVRRSFPDAKIINACDMTISIEELIADSFDYDRQYWISEYYGLNHFGWYKNIYDRSVNRDIMPEIIEKIIHQGFKTDDLEKNWETTYKIMEHMVKSFPTHVPNNYLQYYLHPNIVLEHSDPDYTRANEILDGRLKEIKETVKQIQKAKDITEVHYESDSHGQYIVDMAISIQNNSNKRFMLIVPNRGAIPNLREDAVVELPCYVNSKGVEPISLRENIPDFHKGLMEAQVASEKLLVDAFFENSYQKAFESFSLNQTVPNADVAKKVLDEFIEANGDYWIELN